MVTPDFGCPVQVNSDVYGRSQAVSVPVSGRMGDLFCNIYMTFLCFNIEQSCLN